MKINSASNPQWADEAKTVINLTVDFDGIGPVPFSASPNDSEAHGRYLYAQALAGVYGPVQSVTAKPLAALKTEKIAQIDAAYNAAIQQSVSYMGTLFQADAASQDVLVKTLVTLNAAGATPPGFWWKDEANNKVPVTLAELNGLSMTILSQGWAAFQLRDSHKVAVEAAYMAGDAAGIAAVVW